MPRTLNHKQVHMKNPKNAGNQQVSPKSTTKVVETQALTVDKVNSTKSAKKKTELCSDILTEMAKLEFCKASVHFGAVDVVNSFLAEAKKETPLTFANVQTYLARKLKVKKYTPNQNPHIDDLNYFVASFNANKDILVSEQVGTVYTACGSVCVGAKKSKVVDRLFYAFTAKKEIQFRAMPVGAKFVPNEEPKQAATK